MSNVIHFDFARRVRIPGRDDYLASADRLATAARGQDRKTASSLLRLAAKQRERAAQV